MADELLPLDLCRSLIATDRSLTQEEIESVRESALSLADAITQAYADFKAEVEDFDPAEIKSAGFDGMMKLTGVDITEDDLDDLDFDQGEALDG